MAVNHGISSSPSSSVNPGGRRGAPFSRKRAAFHSGAASRPYTLRQGLSPPRTEMPSIGCQEGFAPHFDLDSTEHSVRTDPALSHELLEYLVRNTGGPEVSDLAARPVIRATAAAEELRLRPPGPDAHFHRCVSFF